MFRRLIDPDNGLMILISRITDCIFLSLFWLLCSFPVVTMGAAFGALYDATFRCFRRKEKNPWQRYLQVFRRNWKSAAVPTVLFLLVVVLLCKGLITVWNAAVACTLSWAVFSAAAFGGVLVLGILSILFPVHARFENSLGGLLKNTVLLALSRLPNTIGLGILNAVTVFLCVRYVMPLFFLPAITALLSSFLIEPMFKPYLTDENAAP